jgi:hypothetical protein
MAESTPEVKQQRAKEFLTLLPLTVELAGLPQAVPGAFFTVDQMDSRATQIRMAYKLARKLMRDVADEGQSPRGRTGRRGIPSVPLSGR